MGIQGLLKIFSSVQTDQHISDYQNKTLAVDTYCWIHKAIILTAHRIMAKSDLSLFIGPVLSQIELLLSCKVKPVMVFDGGKLLSKAAEENSREDTRNQKQIKAKEMLLAGDKDGAYKKFAESVDVTPDLAMLLMKAIRQKFGKAVICIVSPYEADAQLAYLSRIGFVDAIITEDSDLLCFGAKKVLYKMNIKGYVKEVALANWRNCRDFDFKDWTFDQFLTLCILSGCDYLNSLKTIGFKTAYKCLKEARTAENLFKKWRMDSKLGFSNEYQDNFYKAYLTFKFQRVFCPVLRKLVHVNEMNLEVLEKNLKEAGNAVSLGKLIGNFEGISPILLSKLKSFREIDPSLEFLGKPMSDQMACDIADGEINPITLSKYNGAKEIIKIKFGPGSGEETHPKNQSYKEEKEERNIEKANNLSFTKLDQSEDLEDLKKFRDPRKDSINFFRNNSSFENILIKRAQENASRAKPASQTEGTFAMNGVIPSLELKKMKNDQQKNAIFSLEKIDCENLPFTHIMSNKSNLLNAEQSGNLHRSVEPSLLPKEDLETLKNSQCLFLLTKNSQRAPSKEVRPALFQEGQFLGQTGKNLAYIKKPFQKDIKAYFKPSEQSENKKNASVWRPKTENEKAKDDGDQSDFSLKSKKKTPFKPSGAQTHMLKSVRLQTPEMIDKLKLKQMLLKPCNPLKRENPNTPTERHQDRELKSRKNYQNFSSNDYKIWEVLTDIQIKPLEIEEMRREFRRKRENLNWNREFHNDFENICSNLFKPLFN